jgi:hypothetical protein
LEVTQMRIHRRPAIPVSFAAALAIAGCGSTAAGRPGASDRTQTSRLPAPALGDACALAPDDVALADFGARSGRAHAGAFPGTCSYRLEGGAASAFVVSLLGPAAEWEGVRRGYVTTRGGARPVAGVGRAAFRPPDARGMEIVVRTRTTIFALIVVPRSGRRVGANDVRRLARAIADGAR